MIRTLTKAIYTEEQTFEIVFPDEESRRIFHEEKARMDRNLLGNILAGKVDPVRGWRILDNLLKEGNG